MSVNKFALLLVSVLVLPTSAWSSAKGLELSMDLNDKQCAMMKADLLSIESERAGRVRLRDLYKKGLSEDGKFNEHLDYLNETGIIDNFDPKDPLVIVPNYIGSPANCKAFSDTRAICCRNECDNLMGSLMQQIGTDSATPATVLQIAAALLSDTVLSPRKLSTILTKHLNMIAEKHGGKVPVRGRLFSQWMHYAFPRECPLPAIAESTNTQTPEEWGTTTARFGRLPKRELLTYLGKEPTVLHRVVPTGTKMTSQLHSDDSEIPWAGALDLPPLTPDDPKCVFFLAASGICLDTAARRVVTYGSLLSIAAAWAAKSKRPSKDANFLAELQSKMV